MNWRKLAQVSVSFALLALSMWSVVVLPQEGTEQPSEDQSASTYITVEDADTVWRSDLVPSSEVTTAANEVKPRILLEHGATTATEPLIPSAKLVAVTTRVAPRIMFEYAATTTVLPLSRSTELIHAGLLVAPRIHVEHAATSLLVQKYLRGAEALIEAASKLTPKVLIEYAESSKCYELRPFHPTTPPPLPPPPLPVWSIVLGVLAAAALVIALTRSP